MEVFPWDQSNSRTSVKFDIEFNFEAMENIKSINIMYSISE